VRRRWWRLRIETSSPGEELLVDGLEIVLIDALSPSSSEARSPSRTLARLLPFERR
jgi:hypothetical protein